MKVRRYCFTLLEVIVSMAVFALMMLGLMQFFTSAQQLWTSTSGRSTTSAEAKMVNSMLALDLANAYYEEPATPQMIHNKRFIAAYGSADPFTGIAFATMRSEKAHKEAKTKLTAVFYRKKNNVFEMRVIPDNQVPTGQKWVTEHISSPAAGGSSYLLHNVLNDTSGTNKDYYSPTTATGIEVDGSKDWELIATNVLRFQVRLFTRKGDSSNVTALKALTLADLDNGAWPYMVQFTLITIDDETARKVRAIKGDTFDLGSLLEADGTIKVTTDGSGNITDTEAQVKQLLQGKLQYSIQGVVLERFIPSK